VAEGEAAAGRPPCPLTRPRRQSRPRRGRAGMAAASARPASTRPWRPWRPLRRPPHHPPLLPRLAASPCPRACPWHRRPWS
jgi:hypothetical protein